jgi:hypothetical protein
VAGGAHLSKKNQRNKMKIDQKILASIFAAISALAKSRFDIVFEVTGTDRENKNKSHTYINGGLEDLPSLINHLDNLKTGTLWVSSADKDGILGKRTIVCRKAVKFRS